MFKFAFLAFGILVTVVKVTVAVTTWTDATANYNRLYQWYQNTGTSLTDLIPKSDQTTPLTVTLSLALDSLNDFDVISGTLELSGSLTMTWTDESSTLIGNDYISTSETSFLIDHDRVWTPSLVLLNAVDTVKKMGQTSDTDVTYKVRHTMTTGATSWQPRVLLKAACTPDVTHYPFDRQNCYFTYTAWGYQSTEILLAASTGQWDMSQFSESSVWKVKSTSASVYASGGSSFVRFYITIEREPLFFTFNILFPVIVLGLLNGFVFLLPAESGERIGFCVTCFLSFVVLLQTTTDFLPQIANPMSLLCYYIILMMSFSVIINILTILLLRIHYKPPKDKVPNWLRRFVQFFTCVICNVEKRQEEMDWPTVARLLDLIFFLGFLGVQTAATILFIVPIAAN